MADAEHDKATTDLLRVVEIMGLNMSSEVAGRVLALRDTDRAAFVRALELVARLKPREPQR